MTVIMERAKALVPADLQTKSVGNALDGKVLKLLNIVFGEHNQMSFLYINLSVSSIQ